MRRFRLFFAIIIFIAVQLPYIYADDAPPDKLEITHAWVVGDTEVLLFMVAWIYGLEHIPEDVLPLPWQDYVEDKIKDRWCGATLTDGKKNYFVIYPMGLSQKNLSSFDQMVLKAKCCVHPIGKNWFPDNNGPDLLNMHDFISQDEVIYLVSPDMPRDLRWLNVRDKLWIKWDELMNQYYVGMYVDSSKTPLEEGETVDSSENGMSTTTFGVHFGMQDTQHEEMTIFWQIAEPEGTSRAKARAAHLADQKPFKLPGFLDKESPLWISYRLLPEDAGIGTFRFYSGTYLIPLESRDDGQIYGHRLSFGMSTGKKKTDSSLVTVARGDFELICLPQEELPFEEGVASAEEINAANLAFHESLKPLINEIADKFAEASTQGPIDMAAKIEDDIFLFAIACEPDENGTVIDWKQLEKADLSLFFWDNPYKEMQHTPVFDNIIVSEVEIWQDIVFTVIEFNFLGIEHRFVLGQGNGILCGAMDFNSYMGDEDEELTLGKALQLMRQWSPQNQTNRMLAALKKSIEESQRIAVEEPLLGITNTVSYSMDEGRFLLFTKNTKQGNQYVSTHQITMVDMSPQAVLAYAAQIFGGMVAPLPGMAL